MKQLQGMALFVEVAKARSFSRAAAMLGMPRSSLSRQISELERAVGLRLLSRTTRKVELTDAGQLYFERCQRIVGEAALAHEELQGMVDNPSGLLRVNLPADFGTDFLAEEFLEFSRRYPALTFHLDLAAPEHANRVFQRCDVAIHIGEQPDSSLIARRVATLTGALYAAPSYLDQVGEPLEPEDLARYECIGFRHDPLGQPARWRLQNGERRLEIEQPRRFSVNSMAMVRRLAYMGAGIAMMAQTGTRQDLAAGRLRRVLPAWHTGPVPVYAVTETRLLPARTRLFIEFLGARLAGNFD